MDIDALKKKYLPKVIGTGINTVGIVAPNRAVDIAIDIFRSPRKGRVESYQKKFLKKFKSVKLSYNGMPVATYDNGKSGQKVLLCHGWESNSYRWRKLYRELSKEDYNIILIDAPAHGASGSDKFDGKIYAGFINAALEYYKPEVLVGHSVGAYSAIFAMSKYTPESIKKVVVLASPDKLEDICDRYFSLIGLNQRLRRRYIDRIEGTFGMPANYFNAANFAKDIKVEGIIIHDIEDDINLYYEAEAIHKSWPQSKLISTSGLGHSLQDESVYKLVLDYVS